jgi:HEAT repeat protein
MGETGSARPWLSLLSKGAVGLALLAAPAAGQEPTSAALARAYQALAAERFNQAQAEAEALLRADPRHHGAATVSVIAAARQGAGAGLTAYERWLAASNHEDAFVLEPVAVAVLRELSNGPTGLLRDEAAGRLAQTGAGSAANGDGVPAPPMAQLGPGLARELAAPEGRNKLHLLRALAQTGYRDAAPQVTALLDDPVPEVRAAAADTLAALGATETTPVLQARLSDPSFTVRASVAAALHRLGDGAGDSLLLDLLASDVPDIQLQAAEAMADGPSSNWSAYIEPLLASEAPMTRLQAARLFLDVDPERARLVLADLLDHPNPVIVAEMATTLEGQGLADVATIRRLLRHADPAVRLHGAGALLRLTGAIR